MYQPYLFNDKNKFTIKKNSYRGTNGAILMDRHLHCNCEKRLGNITCYGKSNTTYVKLLLIMTCCKLFFYISCSKHMAFIYVIRMSCVNDCSSTQPQPQENRKTPIIGTWTCKDHCSKMSTNRYSIL